MMSKVGTVKRDAAAAADDASEHDNACKSRLFEVHTVVKSG
jgi:hypothetical protein